MTVRGDSNRPVEAQFLNGTMRIALGAAVLCSEFRVQASARFHQAA